VGLKPSDVADAVSEIVIRPTKQVV
jgi:hypothetical protein